MFKIFRIFSIIIASLFLFEYGIASVLHFQSAPGGSGVGGVGSRIWFVNSAFGSDNNNGRNPNTPFLTLQKAANSTAPGDTVCIEKGNGYGGGTSGTAPLIISISGSLNKPITYTGCVGTKEITSPYDPNRPVISGTQSNGVITGTYPLSYITINGLELAGWNSSLTWAGVSANAGSGTWGTNEKYDGNATFFGGSTSGQTIHHLTMTNLNVHDFPGGGLQCNYCDYVNISGNLVYNTTLYSPWANSAISLYEQHNIDAGTQTKNYINNNIIYNNENYIPQHASLAGSTTANGLTSSGSTYIPVTSSSSANYYESVIEVTNGCIPPGDEVAYYGSGYIGLTQPTTCNINNGDTLQFGYITDGEGIIVDNNSNSQSDSIAYVGRTQVKNNIAYGNGGPGIECAPYSNYCDVFFNTLYFNQTRYSQGLGGSQGEIANINTTYSNFYNNILYANTYAASGRDQSTSNTTWANNLFYGGNAAYSLPGTGNVTSNPNFVSPGLTGSSNFQLQAGSPALGAASSTFTRTKNIIGNPSPTTDNIGAY